MHTSRRSEASVADVPTPLRYTSAGSAQRWRSVVLIGLPALIGVAMTLAFADEREPILHEWVAPPSTTHGERAPRLLGAPPRAGENPTAIRADDRLLPEPPAASESNRDEPVRYGAEGDLAHDRDDAFIPDYATTIEGRLAYAEIFEPAIVPFKRMTTLDGVGEDYALHVHDRARRELTVGGAAALQRDPFWGSLLVELTPGMAVPIPSVAPDMRILSYETSPRVAVTFEKDGADNYFVRSDDPRARGPHRLVFLVDAPASYFAPRRPTGNVSDLARLAPPPALPLRARRAAAQVHRRLGVDARTPLDVALDRLVAHFRAFQAGAPPPASQDVYLDLALGGVGVCRHRAFAFVVTASALGIPARFVANEAHAFVEVRSPDDGWIRIDLGGASRGLDVAGATGKAMHRPRGDDPFPKTSAFTASYSHGHGDVRGLDREQLGALDSDPSGRAAGPPRLAPGEGLPDAPPEAVAGRDRLVVTVDEAATFAYRGDGVSVRGRIVDEQGEGAAGLAVDLFLATADRRGADARRAGRATTDDDGRFDVMLPLPSSLDPGRYEIFAATPGDAARAPAVSK